MRKSLKRLSAMAMALCLTLGVGYSVRQPVSALDTIETVSKFEESSLREKYPEYFDLTGSKGLEVYVTQTTPDNFCCVLTEGTNRNKTDEELSDLFLNSTSIDEMKAILSCYNIPKEDIFIIPWQNPVWEYSYPIDADYCKKLREMFFEEEVSIKGDVNADGEFNVADVVALQKWLLGNDVELKNWKAADLCEDDKLDVFDLCLMKRELINSGIVTRNMTREEFLEILLSTDEFTWSDFEQYKSEDIGSGIFILRYEIEMENENNVYLFVSGDNMDEKPDDIYLMRSDNPYNEDYEKEDIYKLKSLLILMTPPDNSEEDRETAQKVADFAFSELKNGNMTIGESWDLHKIDDTELAKAYEEHYFSYFEFINENTLMITLDRGGFFKVYGYLITDGAVEYPLGWNDNINESFDDGGAFVNERYDNIYFFCAGT